MFFFPVITASILLKCYFLDFRWIFFSLSFQYISHPFVHKQQQTVNRNICQSFVHKRTANGHTEYFSTVCAQMFGCRFMHKCFSVHIVHSNIWPIYRSIVCAKTDSKRSTEICVKISFIRNFLLCMGMGENVGHELVQPYVSRAVLGLEKSLFPVKVWKRIG